MTDLNETIGNILQASDGGNLNDAVDNLKFVHDSYGSLTPDDEESFKLAGQRLLYAFKERPKVTDYSNDVAKFPDVNTSADPIGAVDDWRNQSKELIGQKKDFNSLLTHNLLVNDINQTADEEIANLKGKDLSRPVDLLNRVAQGAINQAGSFAQSDTLKDFAKTIPVDPDTEGSLGSNLAQGVGQLGVQAPVYGGAALAGGLIGGPVGASVAVGALGAEQLYDSVEEERKQLVQQTGSENVAADIAHSPLNIGGEALDVFGDIALAGTEKAVKMLGKTLPAIEGMSATGKILAAGGMGAFEEGIVGGAIPSVMQAQARTSVTGEDVFDPQRIGMDTLSSGILGAAFGGGRQALNTDFSNASPVINSNVDQTSKDTNQPPPDTGSFDSHIVQALDNPEFKATTESDQNNQIDQHLKDGDFNKALDVSKQQVEDQFQEQDLQANGFLPDTYYHGSPNATFQTLEPGSNAQYGQGIYTTDNPDLADAYTNSKYGESKAKGIYPVRIKAQNTFDSTAPLSLDDALQIVDKVDGADKEFYSNFLQSELQDKGTLTGQDLLNVMAVDPVTKNRQTSALQEAGFDSLKINEPSVSGKSQNTLIAFNKDQVKSKFETINKESDILDSKIDKALANNNHEEALNLAKQQVENDLNNEQIPPTPNPSPDIHTLDLFNYITKNVLNNPDIKVRDTKEGLKGSYNPDTTRITLDRKLAQDLPEAERTLAHELTHAFDFYEKSLKEGNPIKSDILTALYPIKSEAQRFAKRKISDIEKKEITTLSENIRPYSKLKASSEFKRYRSELAENLADFGSAYLLNRDLAYKYAPTFTQRFEEKLKSAPIDNPLRQAFDWAEKIRTNKLDFAKVIESQQQRANKEQYQAVLKGKEKPARNWRTKGAEQVQGVSPFQPLKSQLRQAENAGLLDPRTGAIYENNMVKFFTTHDVTGKFIQGAKQNLFPAMQNVAKKYNLTDQEVHTKLVEFAINNRILNENSPYLEGLRQNRASITQEIQHYLDKGLVPTSLREKLNDVLSATDDTDFADKIAAANYDFSNKKTASNVLSKNIQKFIKESGQDITSDLLPALQQTDLGSRRYVFNPEGRTTKSATDYNNKIRDQYKDSFDDLLKRVTDSLNSELIPTLKESGRLSPQQEYNLSLNKSNYIPFIILDYFRDDPEFNSTYKTSKGTFKSQGDPILSLFGKSAAVYKVALRQIATNNLIKGLKSVGELPGTIQSRIVLESKNLNDVYNKKNTLEKQNPEKSYLIERSSGAGIIHEFDSPVVKDIFKRNLDLYDQLWMRNMADITNTVKGLWTVYSPRFAITQPILDRFNEIYHGGGIISNLMIWNKDSTIRNSLEISKLIKEGQKKFRKEGFDPFLDKNHPLYEDFKDGSIPYPIRYGDKYAVTTSSLSANEISIPDLVDAVVNGIQVENKYFEKYISNPISKLGLTGAVNTWLDFVQRGETTTKLVGKRIFEKRGLSSEQSSLAAQKLFGTPDSHVRGRVTNTIDPIFPFASIAVNSFKSYLDLAQIGGVKSAVGYLAAQLPMQLLKHPAISIPLLLALGFPEERVKVWAALWDKMSSYTKNAKNDFPIGALTKDGLKFMGDVTLKDLEDPETKAWTIKIPLPQSHRALTRVLDSALNGITGDGPFVKNASKALTSEIPFIGQSNMTPLLKAGVDIVGLASGNNPHDNFRNKDIIPKDIMAADDYRKYVAYLKYAASQVSPFPYNSQNTSIKSTQEAFVAGFPGVSALSSFTNGGDYERARQLEDNEAAIESRIKLDFGSGMQELATRRKILNSQIDDLKKQGVEVPYEMKSHQKTLNKFWSKNGDGRAYIEDIKDAKEMGDQTQVDKLYTESENYAKDILKSIK